MPRRKEDFETPKKRRAPAMTLEEREDQMIALSMDLAERQLREGTASAQVISHYLKLGSTKERLERRKLAEENALLHAKTESIKSAKRVEELYSEALRAMQAYSGHISEDEESDEDY